MRYGLRAVGLVFVALSVSACGQLKDQIIGRWDARLWKNVYVQFNQDGTLTINGGWQYKWLVLDDGRVQISEPNGYTSRCNITINGKIMTVRPAKCISDWYNLGDDVELEKQ